MTFDGISAIQTRIQSIEQQVSGVAAPATAATAGSGTTNGADFASLLTDAMSTQAANSIGDIGSTGSTDPSSATDGSSPDISSLLSEANALTGSSSAGSVGATSSSDITSLLSSLSGAGGSTSGSDITSLLSSLTGTGASSTDSSDITSLLSALTGSSATSSDTSDISSLLSSLASSGASAAPTVDTTPNATTTQFLTSALSQQGKPYVWGATASPTDASPAAFDCSELTKWAAARSGVTIPDGAAHQYVWLKQQGDTMTVQQALQTPGALLFHFASEPQPGLAGEPPVAHVAISLGNGLTIQAKGKDYGVGVFPAGNEFNYAGMIPGMD